MSAFETAVEHTLRVEGGFVDDPADPGGATNWGITLGVFRRWSRSVLGIPGTRDNLEDLGHDDAMKIYKVRYWDPLNLDEVAAVDEALAQELFDTGVNMGQNTAVEFLQRLLNVMNDRGRHYEDLEVDGKLGPKTLAALNSYVARRGDEGARVLIAGLNCLQGARYVSIAENREASEKFLYGWLKQRVAV